jgi:3-keto-disaccharide hydrolase
MRKTLLLLLMSLVAVSLVSYSQEKDWQNLFDGKTLNGWKKLAGTAEYKVDNGMIVGTTVPNSPNTFLVTEKEFGDFILELEVKIEDTTSNSGIQYRSHYDEKGNKGKGKVFGYQFELDPSSRRWTGGIYDEGRRDWLYPLMLHPAAQNAFKLGVFNKIRIECIGNETKTWVNYIPAAYLVDSMDHKGFIALQVHAINNAALAGEKIYWKNIHIQTKNLIPAAFPKDIYVVNTIPNYLSPFEKKSGWKLLFDGVSNKGWMLAYSNKFPDTRWVIKNGTISVVPLDESKISGGDIVTMEQYSAFDLSFEFKLTPGANSGVKYFVTSQEHDTPGVGIGLEYQVLDDSLHPDAKLGRNGNRTMASVYDLIKAEKTTRFIKQPGGWNTGRIVVYPNNHVEHYLNGIKVLEYERGSKAYRDLVAMSKYTPYKNFGEAKEGYILLQDHGNEVSFRSIKIRVLK